jgi:transcriptional regulator with XRE-family HTH domain
MVEGIDGTRILQVARRVAGLSQAELAERAGTSQATLSAYERGAKSPALKVAERILNAMDLEFSIRPHVDFKERHVRGVQAFWFPNMLWTVGPPDCFATLKIPDLINYTEQNEWDLRDRTDRARAYEILIRRCLPQQMIRWLDGALLIDLWDDLNLPAPIRSAWKPAIKDATQPHSIEINTSAFLRPRDPFTTANVRIRGYRPLPQEPPPPTRPNRRPDAVNGRPWG